MWKQRVASRFGIVGRLFGYLWQERAWWLIPMLIVLLLVGGLILFSQSTAVAPFIYTLF